MYIATLVGVATKPANIKHIQNHYSYTYVARLHVCREKRDSLVPIYELTGFPLISSCDINLNSGT